MFGIAWLDNATILGIPNWMICVFILFCFVMFSRVKFNEDDESENDKMTKEDEEEETEEEDEDSEIGEPCLICGEEKEMNPTDEYFDFGETEEDVWICKDCMKKYTREKIITKDVPVEKIVYKTIDKDGKEVQPSFFNPNEKTEFD
jgi:hypothetical protein